MKTEVRFWYHFVGSFRQILPKLQQMFIIFIRKYYAKTRDIPQMYTKLNEIYTDTFATVNATRGNTP